MKRRERLQEIIEILRERGNASTKYLANIFDTSESTIRRDINYMTSLSEYKFIKRVLGGVILLNNKMGLEYMFDLKLNLDTELKKVIASKVIEYVEDGDSIILDSGTTCLYVARQLHSRNGIRVLTTDIKVAEELGRYSNIESMTICGVIRPGYYTVGGDFALETLDKFNVEKVILSADAIDINRGITNASAFEVGIKKKIMEIAKKVFLIVDYTKFNKLSMYHVANITAVDTIITNKELDPEYAERIIELGVELLRV